MILRGISLHAGLGVLTPDGCTTLLEENPELEEMNASDTAQMQSLLLLTLPK